MRNSHLTHFNSRPGTKQWLLGLLAAITCQMLAACAPASREEPSNLQLQPQQSTQFFLGMCDASAAVALDSRSFIVANDEDNHLRVYHRDRGGAPLQSFELSRLLKVDPKSPETDIEAATKLGETVFWITSHGRNRSGRVRQSRHRLFATQLQVAETRVTISLVGKPYEHLLEDLINAPSLRRFRLAEAATKEPKSRNALNIEGLCGASDGRLLVGFRNPIPQKRALIVPVANPLEVIQGKPARLGEPMLLDLGGLGIRDIAFADGQYVIVGGAFDGAGKAHLFTWDGQSSEPRKVPELNLKGLVPEAIIVYPDHGLRRLHLLSDDGTRRINGTPCKELNAAARQFRAVWIEGLQDTKATPPE